MNVLRWSLCVSLFAVAIGCGNVETGGVSTQPTPSGDDDDDSTPGPTATATPGDPTPGNGPVPDHLGGWFTIAHMRSHGDDPTAGIAGSGFFSTQPIPLGWLEPWEALFGGYPSMAMDTCGWGYGASIAIASDGQVSHAAGEISLASATGSGKFLFLPLGGLQLYIAQSMANVFSPSGGMYTLAGTGAQVGPFTTSFQGPAEVVVTQPALTASADPMAIDRSQDIQLTWESPDDGLPLFVFLLQAPDENAAPQVVVCKLEDDGVGVIPSSALSLLQESGWGYVEHLQVLKYRVHTFEAPGAPGPVLVNFASGYNVRVTFE